MNSFRNNIPGILLCLAIAAPAGAFGRLVPVTGGPVTSIVAGMVICAVLESGREMQTGCKLCVKKDTSDSGCISWLRA